MGNYFETRHIYGVTIQLNGETTKSITWDEGINTLITKVYNTDDPSEILIRNSLKLMMAGVIPGVVINDYKDGGVTTIEIIK